MTTSLTMQNVADTLTHSHFHGVQFWDLNALTATAPKWRYLIDQIKADHQDSQIDLIVGLDARGFLFSGALGYAMGINTITARKPGKLPGETVSIEYGKEYKKVDEHGNEVATRDVLHLQKKYLAPGMRVLIVDDVLATGGTAEAACKLIEMCGGIVAGVTVAIEIPELLGRLKLQHHPVKSYMTVIDGVMCADVRYCIDPLITDVHTHNILLIERLSEPKGIAMPGGGVEPFESLIAALMRETKEETNCLADLKRISFHRLLTGADRDPRGVQVSYVFRVETKTQQARGEAGKTSLFIIKAGSNCVPNAHEFAFSDHHQTLQEFVHNEWSCDPEVQKAAMV